MEQKQSKIALILVDIQNDFLETGPLAVPSSSNIIEPVNDLMKEMKSKQGLIIATKDWHPQDHVSFASNHVEKKEFEVKEIEYEGVKELQVMWPDHCVQDTRGSEFPITLNTKDIDIVVHKGTNKNIDSYSAFADNNYSSITPLSKILYQHFVERVYIVGLATDYCVKFTCLDAVKFGFNTVLIEDCTKSVDPLAFDTTLSQLKSKGVSIEHHSNVSF